MKTNTIKRINVKNNQGQYESIYPVANMTIVSDRPIQQGMKYRGTITVDDIEHGDSTFRTESTMSAPNAATARWQIPRTARSNSTPNVCACCSRCPTQPQTPART